MQHVRNDRANELQWLRISTTVIFSMLLLVVNSAPPIFAQRSIQKTFSSAEGASHALFLAVQSDNEQALIQILGNRKELVSSDNDVADRTERRQFALKYEEMHRLVREPDGTMLLYIGAENWPFPIPLASKAGIWYFDADAGLAEILFRQVGENEATAIKTCRALVQAKMQPEVKEIAGDPAAQYAQTLVGSHDPGKDVPVNRNESSGPFHGYYFRMLSAPRKSGVAGAKANVSAATADTGFALIAYPAEYRSSGVLTFVVTQDDVVFEKDLGPNTSVLAKKVTVGTPFKTWQAAE